MPAKGGAIQERAPAWGITPVPERLRTLGGLENGMLWSSLGLSLLVLVAGAFLVPALSLPEALVALEARLDDLTPEERRGIGRASCRERVYSNV